VLVVDRDLAGCDEQMACDLATCGEDRDLASLDQDAHAAAHQSSRDRVPGRAEPHRRQSIDLALDARRDGRPEPGQRAEQSALLLQAL
jgi:hypothetical protein